MKKIIFTICLVSFLFSSCLKQIGKTFGDPKDLYIMQKKKISPEIINQLKGTTTVFFYIKNKPSQLDSIKQAVKDGWDLTPVVFDDFNNFDKYATDPKYSYFDIEIENAITQGQTGGSYSNTHYYLVLRLFKEVGKKGKVSTTGLCRIELYPNPVTESMGIHVTRKPESVIRELYNEGVFYNWTPVLLKAQLETAATNLKNNTRPDLFDNINSDNLTQLLAKDTLYVPNSLLNGSDKKENFFSGYQYKYRICTDRELFDIFQIQKRGRLLFEYVISSTNKFVTVYDLKEKKIIYKQYTPISYSLKSKDIERIK